MRVSKQLEDAVFLTALQIGDAGQRALFLEQACQDDADFRMRVEELLAAHGEADALIAGGIQSLQERVKSLDPLLEASGERSVPVTEDSIGKSIGPYRITEHLGSGGGGSVYVAEQETPVRRTVALKIIKLGMDTLRVISRFDAERQALAMMDHPNIARVMEAGATEAGRPYFVMELVRGMAITSFSDSNRLDLRQRLDLFIRVCGAIQHAHQKGVIHRDIKPSNVLVAVQDGEATPKVIDFGIAKAIEGRLGEETLQTWQDQMLGTPAYMSPEQAAFGVTDLDTRSDVYALGVLLFELISGRTPFDPKDLSSLAHDEMMVMIREGEIQRPSVLLAALPGEDLRATARARSCDGGRLISQTKGDLDWIVMKALEKDRSRRYDTANAFAMDLRRYLANEAVLARPPGKLYLLGKLLRRHSLFFAAGTAIFIVLLVASVTSTALYFNAKESERRQTEMRAIAETALRNEAGLRATAESREKLTEAVILLREGNHEGAAAALDGIRERPRKPSLDGVTALRSVGEWLAIQGRWKEASERFLWLLEIDKLDPWGPVTLDTQSCGVVLVENGDAELYRKFCDEAVLTPGATTNGDAAGRILKTCLLLKPDKELLKRLEVLGDVSEKWFKELPVGQREGWAAIPSSLWNYRRGEHARVLELLAFTAGGRYDSSAHDPTVKAILAMAHFKTGDPEKGKRVLAMAKEGIDRHFSQKLSTGESWRGMWYDWLFARAMVREATEMAEKED